MVKAEYIIWFAFPIAEAVAMIVAVVLLKRTDTQKIEPMKTWTAKQM